MKTLYHRDLYQITSMCCHHTHTRAHTHTFLFYNSLTYINQRYLVKCFNSGRFYQTFLCSTVL